MSDDSSLRFEALDAQRHDRNGFACGEVSLERYLKEQARKEQENHVAVIFVLTNDQNEILGYYSLSATSVLLEGLPDAQIKKLPRYPQVPTTLLGRLAVHLQHQGQGFGANSLIDALRRAYLASLQVASWAVVVDALHEKAAQFYEKYGFIPLPGQPLRLFMPMKTIRVLLEKNELV
jgi:GNAT superfamily N-acetyltransferase